MKITPDDLYFPLPFEKSSLLCEILNTHYNESWRTYHNSEHILRCLEIFKIIDTPCLHRELGTAILFHDIIYEIGSTKNEENSAKFALKYAPFFVSEMYNKNPVLSVDWGLVEKIIIATKHTGENLDSFEERFMVNIDLYDLGGDRYILNSEKIQSEYTDGPVKLGQFETGRKQFLKQMLERPFIYYTLDSPVIDALFFKKEQIARWNMEKELHRLNNPIPF